ncbi:helicase-related protein [Sulfurimonas sp. RIFOXYB12_FULL_35_9]|uniref:helicase-related protein n=1 Tax=Sulfurimonas sp. RIFOXYB12_FULL_35_9 TaxID=1802256 RepID=UPI0008D4F1D3|nr:helicase-related protein [Sulfurimonas sp. RIFOXYB12_FULL_35_9]OHE05895.1 MAG: helicase [Sulfurimonas sp. RIFOXYB12_FULL_35_9]
MLIDNKRNNKLGDVIKSHIKTNSNVSIVTNHFTIHAYKELKKELRKIKNIRIICSASNFKNDINLLSSEQEEIKLKNSLNQTKIAKEFAQFLEHHAQIKETASANTIPFNFYHIKNEDGSDIAIQGSSNFSSTGLGYTTSKSFNMNTAMFDHESTNSFLKTFDEIWANNTLLRDIKEKLLSNLEEIYTDKSPQFLYFMTLYNIFKDFIGELDEEKIIKTKTGFKDSVVWSKLYNFQRDGVLGAIEKLEKYNGCIIADSVGLGKTFEALAVIKYYELRNDRVLVLAPKKLKENWTIYTINDKRNILSEDRLNYDVLNHTDLTRASGYSGEINLATLNWSNYDLIVIDESHNFRNTSTNKKKSKSRYSTLLDDVLKKGVKTKVLMLSATPVNNRLTDLKNQVAFITEANDEAFKDVGIKSIDQTLRKSQNKFNSWLKLSEDERTTKKLLDSLNFDYFKLLDLITIARSRKHIEKYYDTTSIGKFPNRNIPTNLKPDIDILNAFPPLLEINKTIRRLTLSAYSPLKYVYPHKQEEYSYKYDIDLGNGQVFRQIDRENSLIHLMRVNLFKRMESSINSFSLTLIKLMQNNQKIIDMLESENGTYEEQSIIDVDIESDEFASQLVGNKIKVLIQDVDKIRWKQDLQNDLQKLEELLGSSLQVDARRDKKLQTLKENITQKINNPLNPNNKKVVIFTAFADTAEYLYKNIASWAKNEFGLESCLITGSGNNQTTMQTKNKDLNSLLTHFSPISKSRDKTDPHVTKEIDILIATDCISEGQNLQDCDYLVNYDIHWNPVRIIQRFGRIDRLGSKNETIQLVNFWANMELDEYINLESRVSGRMVLLDVSATGEENIIDTSNIEVSDLSYRAKQLKELQNKVIDLEDVSGGISITDLTLNDFRMDLMEYLKTHKEKLENAPLGIHSIVSDEIEKGVVFCIKSLKPQTGADGFSLEPYFLVHVDKENEIRAAFSSAKLILDMYKNLCLGKDEAIKELVAQFEKNTNNYSDMQHYQTGLKVAIESIIGKKEESGMNSLFSRGGTSIATDGFSDSEDFELISFLVIE